MWWSPSAGARRTTVRSSHRTSLRRAAGRAVLVLIAGLPACRREPAPPAPSSTRPAPLAAPPSGPAVPEPTFVEALVGDEYMGCACSLRTLDDHLVFFDDGNAKMKLEGVVTEVDHDDAFGLPVSRSGERHRSRFELRGLSIEIDWVVTAGCSPGDECEFTGADAVITARRDGPTQTVRARGGCGC